VKPFRARWPSFGSKTFGGERARGGEFAAGGFHRQLVAADFADLHRRHAHELGAFDDFHGVERFATDDDARLCFAEEQGVEADL
jgi:hypothetical protein